mmetsp:Transcript_6969/g.15386  ORF Transcript_6969/g.15386 Transcript_6969/m.15386 type:complete len:238 (-) Transcript_6969:170-883(-)
MSTIMRFISSSITTALSDQQQSQQGQQSQQSQFQSSSIANLSSRDRESLIHDIATEINDQDVESSLVHLEHTLDQCHVSLVEFEKKERFVGLRLERYKGLMWRREERMKELMEKIQQQNNGQQKQRSSSPSSFSSLHENDTRSFLNEDDNIINDETDLENNALQTQTTLKQQLTTLQTKHAIDTQSLLGVEGLHKNLIVQIEVLRRRIRELETKQEDIARKKEECRDFLIAASAEFT